ncbi:MBOAT family protein [Ideonella sp. A 288]|uniref:MBOAT family O-acyltransferase n=1 Tax=Ideonella sp. A 288 TaxID=1962181 RepID=UPI000B4BB918|nr:MBOAT family O-acyltransferase [Ideonella sp. A 288]
MLFNSFEFIFGFLPVVWLLFFAAARWGQWPALLWLTAASLFFYGWWNPRLLWLLLASAAANFLLGRLLSRWTPEGTTSARSRGLLVAAVTANLLLLGYYKYTNFLIGTANALLSTHTGLVDLVLPLGISFFTFTQIAYLVDIHRGLAREADALRYLLFVTYFPHLIAGPVIHHQQMMPQFGWPQNFRPQRANMESGLAIFAIGLFKKVVIADHLALLATPVFDAAAQGQPVSTAAAWVGALAYALQLYFDFSGYSDMAVGLSRMFNITLPINFDSPYKAGNLIEFWRRWHMTLSAFLRDYLYIGLGGNRRGKARRFVNLFLTMLLGGLWHGASWNFVLWGALHGLGLIVNHAWRALAAGLSLPTLPGQAWAGRLFTFLFVVLAWVPFRAADLPTTWALWARMADLGHLAWPELCAAGHVGLLLALAVAWWLPNTVEWVDRAPSAGPRLPAWRATPRWGVAMGATLGVSMLFFSKNSPFLYFQF